MVGIPMFGITLVVVRDEQFNIKAIWAQIDAIQTAQKLAFQPPLNTCSVAAGMPILIRNPRSHPTELRPHALGPESNRHFFVRTEVSSPLNDARVRTIGVTGGN